MSDQHPSTGELQLDDRAARQRVSGLSTELADISEVEYRQLRLERVILVGVWTQDSLVELAALAKTAGSVVLDVFFQHRHKPDPATYIGSGKTDQLRQRVQQLEADTIICDGELSPAQLTALEREINVKVIDRTALILDIFAQHVTSAEGKAQVLLAQMEYMLPRLRGWGESLSRQGGGRAGGSTGGVGLRGPGETKIETDRRRIRQRMARLRRDIKAMQTVRDTKRHHRHQQGVTSAAIIGYTNAGKSSLLNTLTGAGVLVQDALFATLETTTRRTVLPNGRPIVLTDTVGFVRYLPTQLIEAFRSTLEEALEADLLIHVVDGSDPNPAAQISTVHQIMDEVFIQANHPPVPELVVINKIDCLDDITRQVLANQFPDAVCVSTRTGEGLEMMRQYLCRCLPDEDITIEVMIPYQRGDLVACIYHDGHVEQMSYGEQGTHLRAHVPAELASRLEEFSCLGQDIDVCH